MNDAVVQQIERLASLVRDLGLIIGVPVMAGVVLRLWRGYVSAFNAQMKALQDNLDAVKSHNDLLAQLRYDRMPALLEAHRKILEHEREEHQAELKALREANETELASQRRSLGQAVTAVEAYAPLNTLAAEVAALRAKLDYYFDRLWFNTRIRAQQEFHGMGVKDPYGTAMEYAEDLARHEAEKLGVLDEWNRWRQRQRYAGA
jgi:glycyl-tRNA synthetase beta subunit